MKNLTLEKIKVIVDELSSLSVKINNDIDLNQKDIYILEDLLEDSAWALSTISDTIHNFYENNNSTK